jgi:hypothetical protein
LLLVANTIVLCAWLPFGLFGNGVVDFKHVGFVAIFGLFRYLAKYTFSSFVIFLTKISNLAI